MPSKIIPITWFEIPVHDLARARSFYEAVFECELTVQDLGPLQMAWFPMHDRTTPGATGTLVKAESYVPSKEGTMVYFEVDNIEATLDRVEKHGGKTLNPKMSIGEYGFVGHFEDCEGNRVALHSVN